MFCSLFQKPYTFNWITEKTSKESSVDIELPNGQEVTISIDLVDKNSYALNFTIDHIDWESVIDSVPGYCYQQLLGTIVAAAVDWRSSASKAELLYFVVEKPVTAQQLEFSSYLAMRIAKVTTGTFSMTETSSVITLRINW